LFFDRSRRAGRYLEWKVRLFTLGAVLAVVGMATYQSWMTWLAIGVLGIGLALRYLPGGREAVDDAEVEGGGAEEHVRGMEGDPPE
jgi:hypothetical protein